jgi:serine/threonine protein phosphatase PrpC
VLTQRDVSEQDLALLLAASIQSANRALYQHNQRSERPMGCTVTAALITEAEITICHVGKNRGYFLPDQPPLRRLTVDHSIVESLVVAGLLQRDEVYTHPKRNRIFRCLGQAEQVDVDTLHVPATAGDRLLFCSDGLWEVLRDPAIEETLRAYDDGAETNSQLLALAQERGGMDDITSILVDLTDDFHPPKRPGISRICSNQMDLEV